MIYALAGFWLIPDFPTMPNPRSFWLRPRDVEMAVERTAQFRRSANKKFTWSTVKRTVRSPLIYFFATLYPAAVLAQAGYQCESRASRSLSLSIVVASPEADLQTSRSSSGLSRMQMGHRRGLLRLSMPSQSVRHRMLGLNHACSN